jgi:hypothetical protein
VAKRGRKTIGNFAEDLGRLLGTAESKARGWLGQRHEIAKNLEQIRDTAAKLLTELGHRVADVPFPRALAGRRRGRPVGSKNKKGIIIVGGKKKRKMSAKARAAISKAQKARWAKQKAGDKK